MFSRHLLIFTLLMFAICFGVLDLCAQQKFVPPDSERAIFNFNLDWKFLKQDAPRAEVSDKQWEFVSTSHTWNDIDSYDEYISRAREKILYMGPAWYRKHFKLPESARGSP